MWSCTYRVRKRVQRVQCVCVAARSCGRVQHACVQRVQRRPQGPPRRRWCGHCCNALRLWHVNTRAAAQCVLPCCSWSRATPPPTHRRRAGLVRGVVGHPDDGAGAPRPHPSQVQGVAGRAFARNDSERGKEGGLARGMRGLRMRICTHLCARARTCAHAHAPLVHVFPKVLHQRVVHGCLAAVPQHHDGQAERVGIVLGPRLQDLGRGSSQRNECPHIHDAGHAMGAPTHNTHASDHTLWSPSAATSAP